ncbi:four helix bundle protein [Flaviaesturariibacter terrae]
MPTFKRFEDIIAWQLARELCKEIRRISLESDLSRDFKLRDQVNASSGSIMDNIAEGHGRGGNKEFIQFLEFAHASGAETQSQLYRILDRDYVTQDEFDRLYRLCGRAKAAILNLINYLKGSNFRGPRFTTPAQP